MSKLSELYCSGLISSQELPGLLWKHSWFSLVAPRSQRFVIGPIPINLLQKAFWMWQRAYFLNIKGLCYLSWNTSRLQISLGFQQRSVLILPGPFIFIGISFSANKSLHSRKGRELKFVQCWVFKRGTGPCVVEIPSRLQGMTIQSTRGWDLSVLIYPCVKVPRVY